MPGPRCQPKNKNNKKKKGKPTKRSCKTYTENHGNRSSGGHIRLNKDEFNSADEARNLVPEKRQNRFIQQYVRADALLTEAQQTMELSPCSKSGGGGDANLAESFRALLDPTNCDYHMHAVACVIQAWPILTDNRLPIPTNLTKALPGCKLSFHCTGILNGPTLRNISCREFLVMLVDSFGCHLGVRSSFARRILKELQTHLDNDWINFDELEEKKDDELFCHLTEADVRFAVAVHGIKVCRHLYRTPYGLRETSNANLPPQYAHKEPTTQELLADCFLYSKLEHEIRPWSPVGSSNMAWCEWETRNFKAAYDWQVIAVENAVSQENDIVASSAKVDLAGYMIFGSGQDKPYVKRAQVEKLYTEFLEGCDRLEEWSMVNFAIGEAMLDEMVKKYLKQNKSTTYYNGEPGYSPTLDLTAMLGGEEYRDRGCDAKLVTCGFCKVKSLNAKRCAQCHMVLYCKRDCQLQHWKEHKKDCKRWAEEAKK